MSKDDLKLHGCPDWMNPQYNPCAKIDPQTGRFQVLDFSSIRPSWMKYAGTISMRGIPQKPSPTTLKQNSGPIKSLEEVIVHPLPGQIGDISFAEGSDYLAVHYECANLVNENRLTLFRTDFSERKLVSRLEIPEHFFNSGIAFTPDNQYMVNAYSNNLKMFNMDISNQVSPNIVSLAQHGTGFKRVAFHPDNRHFATSTFRGVLISKLNSKEEIEICFEQNIHNHMFGVEFSPCGKYLAMTSSLNLFFLLEVDFAKKKLDTVFRQAFSDAIYDVSFSPNGRNVALAFYMDVATIFELDLKDNKLRAVTGKIHPGQVSSVNFSQDGSYLATACKDRHIRVYQAVR